MKTNMNILSINTLKYFTLHVTKVTEEDEYLRASNKNFSRVKFFMLCLILGFGFGLMESLGYV